MLQLLLTRQRCVGMQCTVELNGVKGSPSDAIVGSIERLGQDGVPVAGGHVCSLEGSWLGYIDFGGIRSPPIGCRVERSKVFYACSTLAASLANQNLSRILVAC